ncbi:MAG: DUF4349 domain-containing protein [Chloroflexota bacterium]|nr:DUF4349 domain-containing protein [Chloroflexota bacterium]MDE2884381.1 DUF4349 domain-containing protein [Chloroflexota bacterium]
MKKLTTITRILTAALALAAPLLAAACSGDEGFVPVVSNDSRDDSAAFMTEESQPSQPMPSSSAPAAIMESQEEAADASGGDGGSGSLRLSPLAQNRVIVHTARMSLVVNDVAGTVDRIAGIASSLGGWLVSSDRTSKHTGAIAIRVPAASLDQARDMIERAARDVVTSTVTSDDVTDQYVDTQSRLNSLRATEARLLGFLEQTQNVEEALKVQSELSSIQLQIEEMQGRLNYYDQVAAFSLIEVNLTVAPLDMSVDVGPDEAFRVGEPARFRATFTPPPDIDDFEFVWDFGDGSTVFGVTTAPTPNGQRVTATVNHVYPDDHDSPYIVSIEITGRGEGGIAEGSDSLLATVTEVPTIEVFAGEHRTVEEGDEVRYTASFTAPDELWDYEYQWDFGDGSPTVSGEIDEGTRVEAEHAYADYRPFPYTVELTVSAMSDAGRISASGVFDVSVTESEGFVIGGVDVEGTFKTAVRALSAVGVALFYVLIWLVVFIPLIVLGWIVFRLGRRVARRYNISRPSRPGAPVGASPTTGEE